MSNRRERASDQRDVQLVDDEHVRSIGNGRFVIGTGQVSTNDDEENHSPSPRYAFDVVATVDGRQTSTHLSDDDVGRATRKLLQWTAGTVAPGVDSDAAVGLLLVGGNTPLSIPLPAVRRAIDHYGLPHSDSIANLLAAASEDGAFEVPAHR